MLHKLKIDPVYFEQKLKGKKPWEIRLNDRFFSRGDILELNECDKGIYTGRKLFQTVREVFADEKYICHGYALLFGDVVLYTSRSD